MQNGLSYRCPTGIMASFKPKLQLLWEKMTIFGLWVFEYLKAQPAKWIHKMPKERSWIAISTLLLAAEVEYMSIVIPRLCSLAALCQSVHRYFCLICWENYYCMYSSCAGHTANEQFDLDDAPIIQHSISERALDIHVLVLKETHNLTAADVEAYFEANGADVEVDSVTSCGKGNFLVRISGLTAIGKLHGSCFIMNCWNLLLFTHCRAQLAYKTEAQDQENWG